MTAFKFQIYNPGGSSDFEFDDDGIVAFWLAENISGMSADLERRSVHQGVLNPFTVSSEAQNSFAVTTKAQNSKDSLAETEAFWSPFTSSRPHGYAECTRNDFNIHEDLTPPCRLRIRTQIDLTTASPSDFLGLSARLSIACEEATPRYFHGTIFKAIVLGGQGSSEAAMEFLVCPWIWYLAYTKKSRILSGNSLQIFSTILGEYPANLIDSPSTDQSSITSSLKFHEFATQYQESDYAFISRLFERDGLFFYFDHSEDECRLIIGEDNTAFLGGILDVEPIDLASSGPKGSELFSDYVTNLNLQEQFVPEQYRTRDYDADNATASLDAKSPSTDSVVEIFDYPGGFNELSDGLDNVSPRRAKMLKSVETLCMGFGKHQLFMPGVKVALPDGPSDSLSPDLLSRTMLIRQTVHTLERQSDGLPVYKNAFDLMPIENDFSPAPLTPTPVIRGPVTAIVTTTSTGEEIDVDENHRPMIRYKWDKDNLGIRVRLAQGWAGASHGMQILPRVGDEVIIEFLDGDIDRPVIVGSLYNSASKALYDATVSGEISEVSETEGQTKYVSGIHDSGGNQLLFYDKFGSERVMFIATGSRDDMTAHRLLTASNDRVDVTKNNKVEDVLNDYTLYVGGNLKIDVVGNINFSHGGNLNIYEAATSDDIERK